MIGRDNLNRCSSISYENSTKRLILSCALSGTSRFVKRTRKG